MLESTNLSTFSALGLAEPITRAVAAAGYSEPTPIQSRLIPEVLGGRDVLGIAQTGTGKTAAFVLPVLDRLAATKGRPAAGTCRALILVPTRELAAQVAKSVQVYGQHVRYRSAVLVGGTAYGPQIRALSRGVDILIATPGRLEDHLQRGSLRLDETKLIVLDEADQMLDLGFHPAILRITAKLAADRQSVLLSATMPLAISTLANRLLTSPEEIRVAAAAQPVERIEQSVHHVEPRDKRAKVLELLQAPEVERAIVFTRTKYGADKLCQFLNDESLVAGAIHGAKTQSQRNRTMDGFRRGRLTILVATDLAARGLDVSNISHVINYELPNIPEVYVHRIGRTGRAGNAGIAISLCDASERGFLRSIERLTGKALTPVGEVPADAQSRRGKADARPARRRGPRRPQNGQTANAKGSAKPHANTKAKQRKRG